MNRTFFMRQTILTNKIKQNQFDLHLQRLQKIKSLSLNKHSPSANKHLDRKKLLRQQQKRTEIQRQNIILFNKMTKIMNRQQKHSRHNHVTLKESRIKQEESNRIYQQNRMIMERIQNQKPTISAKKLYEQRAKKEKILKYLGRFPYKLNPLRNRQTLDYQYQLGDSDKQYPKTSTEFKIKQRKQYTSGARFRNQPQSRQRSLQRNKNQVITLYRGVRQINNQKMYVEIHRLYNQYQFLVREFAQNRQYQIKLTQTEGNQIFTKYNYNYQRLTSSMRIINNELRLQFDQIKESKELRPRTEGRFRNLTQFLKGNPQQMIRQKIESNILPTQQINSALQTVEIK